jgi:peptide/nickel transport system permease protein
VSAPARRAGDLALGLSLAVLLAVTVLAAWPDLVTSQSPARQSLLDRHRPPGHVDEAGRAHPLGTDHLGRDVWSRLVHGARASLTVGYAGLLLGAAFGVTLGLVAGFRGGVLDRGLVGVVDAYLSFPYILIAIVWGALVRMTIGTLVLIIALRGWVEFARVVRAQVLSIREREFVPGAPSWSSPGSSSGGSSSSSRRSPSWGSGSSRRPPPGGPCSPTPGST